MKKDDLDWMTGYQLLKLVVDDLEKRFERMNQFIESLDEIFSTFCKKDRVKLSAFVEKQLEKFQNENQG